MTLLVKQHLALCKSCSEKGSWERAGVKGLDCPPTWPSSGIPHFPRTPPGSSWCHQSSKCSPRLLQAPLKQTEFTKPLLYADGTKRGTCGGKEWEVSGPEVHTPQELDPRKLRATPALTPSQHPALVPHFRLLAALAPGPSRPHPLSLLGPFNPKTRATITLWVSFALRVLPRTITMGRRSDLRLG